MIDLKLLRERINEIDEQMAALFKERMETVSKVAEYKKEKGLPVSDSSREKAILDRFLSRDYDESFKKDLKDFLESEMFISRRSQERLISKDLAPQKCSYSSAGFLGLEGSFSHKAFKIFFPESCQALGFPDFREIFHALKEGKIECAIVPVENTSTGGINEIYDLMEEYGYYIIGEKCIRVEQSLLCLEEAAEEDIAKVYSHPQAISQCKEFLQKHSLWQLIPCHSTSEGALKVSTSMDKHVACIASIDNADTFRLKVLKENISEDTNHTRFLVISRNMDYDLKSDKVSIILSVAHTSGSLFKVLKHFEENSANMLKIESRPVKGHPWEYHFFIDFTGNLNDEKTQRVLKGIEGDGLGLKLLGNYKGEVTW